MNKPGFRDKIKNYASLLEVNNTKRKKEGLKIKKGSKTQRGSTRDSEILRLTHDFSQNTIIQKNLDAFNEFQKYQKSLLQKKLKVPFLRLKIVYKIS